MSVIYLDNHELVKLYDDDQIMLFNRTEDFTEKNNLVGILPIKTVEMYSLLVSYLDDMGVMVFGPGKTNNRQRN